jgi:hypothetical protein
VEKAETVVLPVCMPTKQLHALKATLSMSPDVKKETNRYTEVWPPAISSLKYLMDAGGIRVKVDMSRFWPPLPLTTLEEPEGRGVSSGLATIVGSLDMDVTDGLRAW